MIQQVKTNLTTGEDRLRSLRFFPFPQARMSRPHSHNDIELNFIVEGTITYLFGGQSLTLSPNNLYVFWAAVPHQIIQLAESTCYFVFHLPLAYFLQWQLSPDFTRQILQGDLLTAPAEDDAAFHLARCERWHRHIQAHTAEHSKITLLEMEACLRLWALSSHAPATASPVDPQSGVDSVARMASFIAQNFQKPLTVADIAGAANLHPNYAMQLFRQQSGRTLMAYLTQYRLAHAQQLLLTTHRSVLDIALDSGFCSLSRFYAVFKKFCHVPPTRYRQGLRQPSESTPIREH